jgi:hypothetical protein
MSPVRSYVVRIYRSGRAGITGVVEDVKTGRTRPFSSVTELWDALRRSPRATASLPHDPQSDSSGLLEDRTESPSD